MNTIIQLRQWGTLTLPTNLRKKYQLEEGDTLQIVDLDGIFVLTPMTPLVPELARQIELLRTEAGLSTEDFLAALREERE